jgi:hypothetical protein
VLSLALSATIAWFFAAPIKTVARLIIKDDISLEWARYLRFFIIVVGVSAGTRIRVLEDYLAASPSIKETMRAALTQEFWAVELYRTIIGTLEGVAWLLLLYAGIAFTVLMIVRKKGKLKLVEAAAENPELLDRPKRVTKIR